MNERNDNKHGDFDIYEDQIELLEKMYQRFQLIGDYYEYNIIECTELIDKFGKDSINMINDIIYNKINI